MTEPAFKAVLRQRGDPLHAGCGVAIVAADARAPRLVVNARGQMTGGPRVVRCPACGAIWKRPDRRHAWRREARCL